MALQGLDLGDHILVVRAEAYSCKRSRDDKRLARAISSRLQRKVSHLVSSGASTATPLGDITTGPAQRLLTSLITTLNAVFPDYDFCGLDASAFGRATDVSTVKMTLDANVLRPAQAQVEGVKDAFWAAVEEAIGALDTLTAYLYLPDPDSPLLGNKLWSAVYFLYSPALRRVLLISTWAKSKLHSPALAATLGARAGAPTAAGDEDEDDAAGAGAHGDAAEGGGARDGAGGDGGDDDGGDDDDDQGLGYLYDDDDDDDDAFAGSGAGSGAGAAPAVVNVDMLDWEDLGVASLYLPDTAWVSPSLAPAQAPTGAPGVLPRSAQMQRRAPNSGSLIAGASPVPAEGASGLSPLALATRANTASAPGSGGVPMGDFALDK